MNSLGGKLADIELLIEQKDGERKDEMRRLREELDSLKGTRRELARARQSGYEERDVKVRIDADYDHCCARTFREDTGEVIHERALTADEMQPELFEQLQEQVDELFDEALAGKRAGDAPAPKLTITVAFIDGKATDVANNVGNLVEPDDLRFAREWELNGKKRKTVLDAITERWEELGGDEHLGSIKLEQQPPQLVDETPDETAATDGDAPPPPE